MQTRKIRKVLVIQGCSLSRVALSLPILYAVARDNYTVCFTLLLKPSITALLVDPPSNVEAMTLFEHKGRRSLRSFSRLIRLLRNESFDVVVDLEISYYSRWLAFFTSLGRVTKRVTKPRLKNRKDRDKATHTLFETRNEERQLVKETFAKVAIHSTRGEESISPRYEISLLQEEMPKLPPMPYWIVFAPFGKSSLPTHSQKKAIRDVVRQFTTHFNNCGLAIITRYRVCSLTKSGEKNCYILPCNMLFPVELALLEKAVLVIAPDSAYLYEAEMVGTEAYCLPTFPPSEEEITKILKTISIKISLKEDISSK